MKQKRVVAVVCVIAMMASSMSLPEKVYAAGLDGTIAAFDQFSMEDTRAADKPALSDPDEQIAADTDLTVGLAQSAFRASHEYQIQAGNIGYAYKAFDGNADTRWQSGEEGTFREEWIEADLGGKKKISNISIHFPKKMFGNFVVETSASNEEGAEWTTVKRVEMPSEDKQDFTKSVDLTENGERVEAERYIRLRFTSGNTFAANRSIAISKIEVNGLGKKTVTVKGNLALNKTAQASDFYADYKPEYVTDGISSDAQRALRWQSGENVTVWKDVWLKLDLQHSSVLESIKIKFDTKMYGNFIIQTSDTGDNWGNLLTTTDIQDSDTLHIEYTKTFAEALQAKRYVRLYFNDPNANAANKSISIREVELNGTQELDEDIKPSSAQEVLDKVTSLKLDEAGTQVVFPGISDDYTISLKGSDLKQIISNDAIVTNYNFYDYDVDVLVQAVNKEDETDRAEKNMVLHIPNKKAEYPELFPAIENPNAEPKIIPSVQEWYGYNGDFVLSETTKIVVNDTHNLGLLKAAKNLQKDIKEFTGWEPEVTTNPATEYDIELVSLESDKYDTGKEGYILLNNDNGLKIYSSTYTGIFYGTMSVEQVFYQQRYDGRYSFPKGIMRDYPKFEVRGYMLDVARAPYRLERLYDYAKLMGFYKMNEFHVHLNDNYHQGDKSNWESAKNVEGMFRMQSETFPSLKTDPKESAYYNEAYGGQPEYSKEDYIRFQKYAKTVGVDIMSEIDAPGHALAFNKYVEAHQDEAAELGIVGSTRNPANGELLALGGANYENSAKFIRALWDEYLGIDENNIYNEDDAVFIGDSIQIGADEYWNINTNDAYATASEKELHQLNYIQDISEKVEKAGKRVRIWSQLKQSADKVEEKNLLDGFHVKDLNNIELDLWYNAHENIQKRIDEGFKFVVVNDSLLYGNPGRDGRDIVNAEYLFESWNPYITQTMTVKKGEPGLLGAKTALWADINRMGVTELDINERIVRAASVVAEKTWGGTDENQDYNEFSFKFSRLKNGPGVDVGKEVESKTDLAADYDFANTAENIVYDISGNAHNGAVTGGKVVTEDGTAWMNFDGNTKIQTNVDSLIYPYTVQFDVKADHAKNTGKAILFDGYDGRLSVDKDGNLVVDRSFFHEKFEYHLPDGQRTNITLVGTQQVTKLYVNGVFVNAMIRPSNAEEDYDNLMGTFVFPLKNIGEGFHGQLANIKAYKKAMNAQEVKNSFEGVTAAKVNISQNKGVAGELRSGSGGYDNANEKLHVAWKAIDGDGNTLRGTHAANESEKDSFFDGKLADSYIALDFYRPYKISEVNLQFDTAPASYTLYTSTDGADWTQIGTYTTANVVFEMPVETQYLKVAAGGFKLREIEVYEAVDKADLETVLEEAKVIVEKYGLSFVNKNGKDMFFDTYMNAVSVFKNMYALQADVDAVKNELSERVLDVEKVKNTYKVTVDGIVKGDNYKYNNPVTLEAPEAPNGQVFAGWEADGKIVSVDSPYTFYVSNDIILTSKFVADPTDVKQEAIAFMTNVLVSANINPEKSDIKFVGQLVIPKGYTLVNAGLVWSSKDTTALELGSGLTPTYIKSISTSNQFSVTIKGVPNTAFLRGRIFATVRDANGSEKTIYSTERKAFPVK